MSEWMNYAKEQIERGKGRRVRLVQHCGAIVPAREFPPLEPHA
jgi:hypothetical protein